MIYETKLPRQYKYWRSFYKEILPHIKEGDDVVRIIEAPEFGMYEIQGKPLTFKIDYIKAMCFDEIRIAIKDLAVDEYENCSSSYFNSELKKLLRDFGVAEKDNIQ